MRFFSRRAYFFSSAILALSSRLARVLGPGVRFLGASPSARGFLTFGVFPIQRGQGDLGAIEHSVQLVKTGRVLGMFPEGTRSHTGALRQGKTGVVRIAMMANVAKIEMTRT